MTNQEPVMNKGLTLDKLAKEFKGLTSDIEEISKQCSDPFFIALLLFQLAKEREQTNKIIADISERLKALENKVQANVQNQEEHTILAEVDQRIVALADQKGMISADDVKALLSYNCVNAASQRLNKLFREGYLAKVRAGKKVFFTIKKTSLLPTPNHPHKQSPL
ncbi:MAG: hypothetical protein N3F05_01990 [Candidatus Diapherotrites archaeon]|nr:hypothetical protein [Candidatus Diapherotrites archaeon]